MGGYRFVWDFTAGQTNGTIAAAGMAHAEGRKNGFGSLLFGAITFMPVKRVSLRRLNMKKVQRHSVARSVSEGQKNMRIRSGS